MKQIFIDNQRQVDSNGYMYVPYPYYTSTDIQNIVPTQRDKGLSVYDTTLNRPVYWNGTKWIDKDGFTAALGKGTTAQRPTDTLTIADAGYQYFDTTLGKPIYLKVTGGVKSWVDATGAEV